jgi:hypothetical protein
MCSGSLSMLGAKNAALRGPLNIVQLKPKLAAKLRIPEKAAPYLRTATGASFFMNGMANDIVSVTSGHLWSVQYGAGALIGGAQIVLGARSYFSGYAVLRSRGTVDTVRPTDRGRDDIADRNNIPAEVIGRSNASSNGRPLKLISPPSQTPLHAARTGEQVMIPESFDNSRGLTWKGIGRQTGRSAQQLIKFNDVTAKGSERAPQIVHIPPASAWDKSPLARRMQITGSAGLIAGNAVEIVYDLQHSPFAAIGAFGVAAGSGLSIYAMLRNKPPNNHQVFTSVSFSYKGFYRILEGLRRLQK